MNRRTFLAGTSVASFVQTATAANDKVNLAVIGIDRRLFNSTEIFSLRVFDRGADDSQGNKPGSLGCPLPFPRNEVLRPSTVSPAQTDEEKCHHSALKDFHNLITKLPGEQNQPLILQCRSVLYSYKGGRDPKRGWPMPGLDWCLVKSPADR